MNRFLAAITFVCVLSLPTLAGEIPTMGAPAPPPPPQGQTLDGSSWPGDIPTDGITEQLSTEALSALLAAIGSLTV